VLYIYTNIYILFVLWKINTTLYIPTCILFWVCFIYWTLMYRILVLYVVHTFRVKVYICVLFKYFKKCMPNNFQLICIYTYIIFCIYYLYTLTLNLCYIWYVYVYIARVTFMYYKYIYILKFFTLKKFETTLNI
jgi:hypothetical protein